MHAADSGIVRGLTRFAPGLLALTLAASAALAQPEITLTPARPTPADTLAIDIDHPFHCPLGSRLERQGDRLIVTVDQPCYCFEENPAFTSLSFSQPPLEPGLYSVELQINQDDDSGICGPEPRHLAGLSFTVSAAGLGLELSPAAPRASDFITVKARANCDFELGAVRRGGSLIRIPVSGTAADPLANCAPGPPVERSVELRLERGPYTAMLVADTAGFPEVLASLSFNVERSFSGAQLLNGRFVVSAQFQQGLRFDGEPLMHQAEGLQLTHDTGSFYFFNSNNIEVMVKVLRGCRVNGHFWVFAAGLTNVGTRLFVTDDDTGALRIYTTPDQRDFQPILDTTAFPCS